MLKLDSKVTLDAKTIKASNLCNRFTSDELARVGNYVWDGYDRDKRSRFKWERRTEAAMDLALQVQKDKNFPWPNCSNIAFPLVTIAALQFHSRAYTTIISGNDVVKCRVIGEDPSGGKRERADRVSTHMSYQVMEEDAAWEEQHDRLLINLPIVGCAFKKSYFSRSVSHNVSELVLARDLVIDYFATSVEAAARKTHIIPLYRNEIYERVMRGTFKNVLEEGWYEAIPTLPAAAAQAQQDNRRGVTPPQGDALTPFTTLEQHCFLDLDQDGYAEPYIITIEESSKTVLRIVTSFDREGDIERNDEKEIISIRPVQYFTKYGFIPSPDGGIYDIGFGVLLGPLNESVSSLINQLTDAGTMLTSAGGFLGRGAKIRGGVYTFAPLEWKRVDSTGDDLKKSIFPLPVREPSAVLFQLLSLLIDYANRIPGTTEAMVGMSTGQNTPAETSRSMIEQGMKIYSTIFKRVWRSMKGEFKKLYVLNGMYLPIRQAFGAAGGYALREDYLEDPNSVVPVADPNITSEASRFAQAQGIRQAALSSNGGYDIEVVERNFLRAMKVDGIDTFYPGLEKKPPGGDPKLKIAELKLQGQQMELQQEKLMFIADLMEERKLNNAKIYAMQAEAAKDLEEAGVERTYAQVAAINASISMLKSRDESLRKRIELLLKGMEYARENADRVRMDRLAAAPGDQSTSPPPESMAAGAEGAMGSGAV